VEILSYTEIIKLLQAELSGNVRLNNWCEPEQNNSYCEQVKTSLMGEDWELVTVKKKRNLDVLNRNLIQIIPTNMNKLDLKHNLKYYEERANMGIKELGMRNKMNHTLIKEKTKYEESQRKYKHKVRLIADSHVKRCATELRMTLDHRYEIMGFTKPGALMSDILTTAIDKVLY
jgi:hypothetical protein